jgi:hypothetical protein
MAKLADAADLKSAGANSPVGVQFPLPAPANIACSPPRSANLMRHTVTNRRFESVRRPRKAFLWASRVRRAPLYPSTRQR